MKVKSENFISAISISLIIMGIAVNLLSNSALNSYISGQLGGIGLGILLSQYILGKAGDRKPKA